MTCAEQLGICISACGSFDFDCIEGCDQMYGSYSSCVDSVDGSNDSYKFTLSESQLSDMGTALTTGGSGLIHIGIQLLPYSIAFTIILLIFGLVKNWSKLKFNKGLGDSSVSYVSQSNRNRKFIDEINKDVSSNYSDWAGIQEDFVHGFTVKGNKIYKTSNYGNSFDEEDEVCDLDSPFFEKEIYRRYKMYK